jgi:hypothetical protein
MLNDALKTLAATPPPAKKYAWRYLNAGKTTAKIVELEKALGLEHGTPIFNIKKSNERILELEAMLAAKEPAPAVAAVPVAPVAAAPEISTRKLEIVAGEFFAGDVMRLAALPENEKRNSLAIMFWKNRMTYPGCESDFARIDTTKNQRNISDAHFAGMNRIGVSIQQELITAKLKKIK